MIKKNLTVYSIAFHPTIHNPNQYENTCRGVFPSSMFGSIHRQDDQQNCSDQPITFSIDNGIRTLYVCAHEFSAQEGFLYLPRSMMESAFLSDGDSVEVEFVFLPKITSVTLQPISKVFSQEMDFDSAKKSLEGVIVKNYPLLQKGEEITFDNYTLIIRDIQPVEVVSTFESDPNVEFLPALDDLDTIEDTDLVENTQFDTDNSCPTNTWKPFQGIGRSLSGKTISTSDQPSKDNEPIISSQANPNKQKTPSIRYSNTRISSHTGKEHSKFKAFAGKGNRLGS